MEQRRSMSVDEYGSRSFLSYSIHKLTETMKMTRLHSEPHEPDPPPKPPMPERSRREFVAIVIGGSLLSFNAGFINAVTLLISGFTVSHVTGATTKAAVNLYKASFWEMGQLLLLMGCFVAGSSISAILINHQTFHLGRDYNRVFLLGSFFIAIGCVFRVHLPDTESYAYFVAIACGMQNAMSTRYSNNVLRTTHCTGTATDVGIVLGHIMKGNKRDMWKLYVLIPMWIAFFLGSLVGTVAEKNMGDRYSLFSNLILFAGTGLIYMIYLSFIKDLPFLQMYFSDNKEFKEENNDSPGGVDAGSDGLCSEDNDDESFSRGKELVEISGSGDKEDDHSNL